MKKSLLISLVALPLFATAAIAQDGAQTTPPSTTISVKAKGDDVRSILADMFAQSKKNFVLEPGVRFVLYLALDKVEFDEALEIVCSQANLKVEIQNGIYYISQRPAKKAEAPKNDPKTNFPDRVEQAPQTKTDPAKPKGLLPYSVLTKRITTRLQKTDIKSVFTEFGKQAGITIEVDPSVPGYKLDAYLINTSLKYALDEVTGAAKLQYKFTDNKSILIFKPAAETNRVTLIDQ